MGIFMTIMACLGIMWSLVFLAGVILAALGCHPRPYDVKAP